MVINESKSSLRFLPPPINLRPPPLGVGLEGGPGLVDLNRRVPGVVDTD